MESNTRFVHPSFKLVLHFYCDFRFFFFFNDTATTEIYTLSLHDALPISVPSAEAELRPVRVAIPLRRSEERSEEHTPELQSPDHLVCRLLLGKKTKTTNNTQPEQGRTTQKQTQTETTPT